MPLCKLGKKEKQKLVWWGGMGGVGGVEWVRKAWRDYIGLGIGLANLCLHQALKPCL